MPKLAKTGANRLEEWGHNPISLTDNENALFAAAATELGGVGLVEGVIQSRVGIHHGQLLLSERIAVESAFTRPDGLAALVATPTVAQGINLPAQAVIIAGDDRWSGDDVDGRPEILAVHELLNAAGRAGRAGQFAHGVVVDLPGKVYAVEKKENGQLLLEGLDHVMSLLGVSDQCLDIVDPITQIIDRIAIAGVDNDVAHYLIHRVANLDGADLNRFVGRTLHHTVHDQGAERREAAVATLQGAIEALTPEAEEQWLELASLSGVSLDTILFVANALPSEEVIQKWSFDDALSFCLSVLRTPPLLFGLVHPSVSDFSRILPRIKPKKDGDPPLEDWGKWEQRWGAALQEVLPLWLAGTPLKDIGAVLHRHRNATGHIKAAMLGRRFAIRTAASLGHACFVIGRVLEASRPVPARVAVWFQVIPGCVREGFDHPDKLLTFWSLRRKAGLYPRVVVHNLFPRVETGLPAWTPDLTVDDRRKVVGRTVRRVLEADRE